MRRSRSPGARSYAEKPTKLQAGKGSGGLFAAEIEPSAVAEPFLTELKAAVQKTAQKGVLLSAEELNALFAHHLPGLEELAALLMVADMLEDKSFDRAIIDLAPTSHSLRLFDLPVAFRKFCGLVKGVPVDKGKPKKEPAAPTPIDALAS